jgi:cell division protein FtsZ
MKFEFIEEKEVYHARIKVFGVGGAGGNAVGNMIASKLKGVDFVAANTDSQALERSSCSTRLQLGGSITKGLGAGAESENWPLKNRSMKSEKRSMGPTWFL